MSASAFIAQVENDANLAAQATGVPESVILAQWGVETRWGTSAAFRQGFNFGGVSPGGRIAYYGTKTQGLSAYIAALRRPAYATVRAAGDPVAAANALAASPWAASHYASPNGGNLIADAIARLGLTRFDKSLPGQYVDQAANLAKGAVAGVVGAAGGVVNAATGGVLGQARSIVITGLFVAGGAALVVAGIVRTAAPHVRPLVDKARSAAVVAATA